MAIAALTIDINARLAGIEGDLGKVARIAERNAAQMTRAFDGVGDAIKGVFSGIAAKVSFDFVSGIIQNAIDAQDALVDLNKSTGIAVETLAGLGFAAKTTGGDLDSIAAAINKLQVNIAKNPEKYKQLGISAKDGYEAFKQLADIFVSIEDPEKRAAVAAEALGKSWAGAAPALSEGAAGFEKLVDKGKSLSQVTEKSAEYAAELNANLDILKAKISGASIALVNSMVPMLNAMATELNDSSTASNRFVALQNPLTETLRAILVLGGNVAFVFNQIGEELGGAAAQIAALAKLDLTLFTNIRSSLEENLKRNRTEFDAWEKRVMNAGNVKINQADYSNEGRGRGISGPSKAPSNAAIQGFIGSEGGGGGGGRSRSGSKSTKAIDDGTRLVEQLRDQIRATQDLTEVEKLELAISDGRYKTATSANLAIAMGYAETLDAIKASRAEAENEIEAQRERVKLFADGVRVMESVRTPTESLNAELQHLLVLLDAEAISMETFGRAAAKAGEEMQRLESKGEKTGDVLEEFAKSAAQNMQKAFADFLFDPFAGGTENMLKTFGNMLRRMIAEAASADIMRRLFGDLSGKGGGGGDRGLIVPFFESIAKMIPSFDVGTPYVPRDMLAVVHQGERIIPAAQNRTGGQSISVVINMTAGAGGSDLRQAAGDVARRIGQTIAGASRYA